MYPPSPLINVEKCCVFLNKKGQHHLIINIVSGGRGEFTLCPNFFVWDCRLFSKQATKQAFTCSKSLSTLSGIRSFIVTGSSLSSSTFSLSFLYSVDFTGVFSHFTRFLYVFARPVECALLTDVRSISGV